jgi:hypothetical protein
MKNTENEQKSTREDCAGALKKILRVNNSQEQRSALKREFEPLAFVRRLASYLKSFKTHKQIRGVPSRFLLNNQKY